MMDMQQNSPAPVVSLTMVEWNVVLAGLGELPLRVSKNVFDKIAQQLQQRSDAPWQPSK